MWRTLLAGSYEPTDWDDIRDLRARWNGPIILKGVVNPRDAVMAAEIGIDAIQVSNHGGRQLDHMASPLDVLPEIVERTAGRVEIIVDGGIRRGSDIVKALALGADACSIGRPYLYGLAAAGQAGVAHVLKLLAAEMTRTMMLLGVSTIQELREEGRDLIRHRSEAFPRTLHAIPPANFPRPSWPTPIEDPLMKTPSATAPRSAFNAAPSRHGGGGTPAGRHRLRARHRHLTSMHHAGGRSAGRHRRPRPRGQRCRRSSCSRNRSNRQRSCAWPSPPTSRRPSTTGKAPRT